MRNVNGSVVLASGAVRNAHRDSAGQVWVPRPGTAANNWQGGWVLAHPTVAATFGTAPRLTQEA